VEERLVQALCLMVAGDLRSADEELEELEADAGVDGLVSVVVSMARGGMAIVGGEPEGIVDINSAVGAAEGMGLDWLARMGRSLLALSGRVDHVHEAARLEDASTAMGDGWGAALSLAAQAWGAYFATARGSVLGERFEPSELAMGAQRRFRALGASALETQMASLAALARSIGDAEAGEAAREAQALARARSRPEPEWFASMAAAVARSDMAEAHRLAAALRESGWLVPVPEPSHVPPPPARASADDVAVLPAHLPEQSLPPERPIAPHPPARLHLFSRFGLEVGGEAVDISSIRPKVRTLLYLLAVEVGRAVHRETIMEMLWPGADPGASARSLHVAVATLRRVLEPGASRGGFRLVPRDGEGYRLALPPGSHVDMLGFTEAAAAARAAQLRGAANEVERWCRTALARCTGELIPEAGPDEWVVERRESLRAEVVEVAAMLAQVLLERGRAADAASVCVEGLRHDRYHDPLWKMLIEARDTAGDRAAASSARTSYARTLAELGLAAGRPT
jgi:DNA-binding SARP family transcriptional activator